MNNARLLSVLLLAGVCIPATAQFGSSKSSLNAEPGTISVEELLPKPLRLTVKQDSFIYYQTAMDRVLGNMAKGTVVTLVGMSDKAYRVRGRARHGDVAGWMKREDLVMPDPTIPDKLKTMYERQQQVGALIAAHQVAIGMTRPEVQQALGKPTRTSTKITAAGREEKLDYAIFEKIPQTTVGQAPNGQLVQTVVYVKVETGTLSISFKSGVVDTIEETKGNPLKGAPIKIVPVPLIMR
jgi:outer membrane protein assembly factor BamE (lipoprotein component of BamABCDE complex)